MILKKSLTAPLRISCRVRTLYQVKLRYDFSSFNVTTTTVSYNRWFSVMTTLHRLLALTITMMLCTNLHSLSVRVNCCGGRGRMMITFTTPPPFSSLLVLGSLHHRWMASSTSGGGAYTCSGGDSMKLFSSSSSNKYSSHGSNSNSNRNNKKDVQHSYRSTNSNAKSGRSSDSEIEVRLNKCIPSLSRRAADDAIAAGNT